jgi:phage recombination protein Bet
MSQTTALQQLAGRLSIQEGELQNIVLATLMPSGKQPSTEQFMAFIAVANEYGLNPLTKEIYAFPAKGGGIQPIVSIDGWLRIINTHPDFNGMTFQDNREDGKLVSITCKIHKKGIEHPIEVTEYLEECKKVSEPWQKWPSRMLRHKTAIQAGRYAFGLSGIIDPDEADRFKESGAIVDSGQQNEKVINVTSDERFQENLPQWTEVILSGRKTPEQMISFLEGKGVYLSEDQANQINNIGV